MNTLTKPERAKMHVTPYGYPKGRTVNFDFSDTPRNGNDLVAVFENVIYEQTVKELTQALTASSASLRAFCAFIEREFRGRANRAKGQGERP